MTMITHYHFVSSCVDTKGEAGQVFRYSCPHLLSNPQEQGGMGRRSRILERLPHPPGYLGFAGMHSPRSVYGRQVLQGTLDGRHR